MSDLFTVLNNSSRHMSGWVSEAGFDRLPDALHCMFPNHSKHTVCSILL